MKIAMVINTAWNIANFRSGLIKALLEENYEIIAIAPKDECVSQIEDLGARFVDISMDRYGSSIVKDISLFVSYFRLFRREEIDCVLTYTIKPNIYASLAANLLRIPVVNNISGLGSTFIRKSWMTMLVKFLYGKALVRSRRVFFQNPEDRELFETQKLVRPEVAATLPGSGIDLEKFSMPEESVAKQNRPVTFLLIARLLTDKGVREYANAAQILKKSCSNVTFQLLGELDESNPNSLTKQELSRWSENDLVSYLGGTSDVRPFIDAADCIVLPSYREGLPRVLLEAGAMGKPAVASDVEGCREVIEHGLTGFLCEVRNPENLAECLSIIVGMSAEQRCQMGLAARKKMEKEFDERLVINSYLDILNCL